MAHLRIALVALALLSLSASGQSPCKVLDAPPAPLDWKSIVTHSFSLRVPKGLVASTYNCKSYECYRYDGDGLSLIIEATNPAFPFEYDIAKADYKERFIFVDGLPAWLWQKPGNDQHDFQFGAMYTSWGTKRFRAAVHVSANRQDDILVAETILRSVRFVDGIRSDADTAAEKACQCSFLDAQLRKTNPITRREVMKAFLFTSRIELPLSDANKELIGAINSRGVDFVLSPEDANVLAGAGASEELIDAIKRKVQPQLEEQIRLYSRFTQLYPSQLPKDRRESIAIAREFMKKFWCDPSVAPQISYFFHSTPKLEIWLSSN